MNRDEYIARGRKVRCDIYAFIRGYKKLHNGKSPSNREIQRACGISTSSLVFYHLAKLHKQNAIQLTGDRYSRSRIELPGEQYVLPEPVEVL